MTIIEESTQSQSVEPILMFPHIAGFWRRFAAWLIDYVILGVFGQIIGWPLSGLWFQIGPYGRFVGLFCILLYFCLMNSKAGHGQTIGKRLLKIAVRNEDNTPISLGKSFLRITIIAIPLILYGWALPVLQGPVMQVLGNLIVGGLGLSILYTMVFNRGSRQGLHDLICKTYVVSLNESPIEAFPKSNRIHWIISGILIGLAVIGSVSSIILRPLIFSAFHFEDLEGINQVLQNDERFFSTGVSQGVRGSTQGPTTHYINAEVWVRGVPTNEERTQLVNDISQVILENVENVYEFDNLTVTITSKFDLDLASGNLFYSYNIPTGSLH
ncbi:MAG TPA: RDD family protein [Longilinea sp.]|nr:RDD family protein [Longilinea sp.]